MVQLYIYIIYIQLYIYICNLVQLFPYKLLQKIGIVPCAMGGYSFFFFFCLFVFFRAAPGHLEVPQARGLV